MECLTAPLIDCLRSPLSLERAVDKEEEKDDRVRELFWCTDVDDSGFISVEELLLLGGVLGAAWSDWTAAACVELIGRDPEESTALAPLSLDDFRQFFALQDLPLQVHMFEQFLEDAKARRRAIKSQRQCEK